MSCFRIFHHWRVWYG